MNKSSLILTLAEILDKAPSKTLNINQLLHLLSHVPVAKAMEAIYFAQRSNFIGCTDNNCTLRRDRGAILADAEFRLLQHLEAQTDLSGSYRRLVDTIGSIQQQQGLSKPQGDEDTSGCQQS